MEEQLKSLVEKLEKELNSQRPHTRQEFQDLLGEAASELEAPLKKMAFNFERAPYIEKQALNEGRAIVMSVSPDSYPEPVMFLFACLQRAESFLYEQVRFVDDAGRNNDKLTLMFRSGVMKIIKVLAGMLPPPADEVWAFRRRALDILEDRLWKLQVSGRATHAECEPYIVLADILQSLAPAEMRDFASPAALAEWFVSSGGESARKIINRAGI